MKSLNINTANAKRAAMHIAWTAAAAAVASLFLLLSKNHDPAVVAGAALVANVVVPFVRKEADATD